MLCGVRSFYLCRRKNGIFYCQFINNAAKARLPGISTGKRSRDAALTATQVLQTLKQTGLTPQYMSACINSFHFQGD
jgi:hypothetical protein